MTVEQQELQLEEQQQQEEEEQQQQQQQQAVEEEEEEEASYALEKLRTSRLRDEEFCQSAADGDLKKLSKYVSEVGVQRTPELANVPMLEDINCCDSRGHSALMLAAAAGHYEAVKLLVANGADVNQQDWNGVTALHLAAKRHQLRVVKFLVMSDARLDLRTRTGLAAEDLAAYNSDTWTVLRQAASGTLPSVDHLVQTVEVPLVPAYAIPSKPKSADGKKSGKKGKKGKKKSGKKKKK